MRACMPVRLHACMQACMDSGMHACACLTVCVCMSECSCVCVRVSVCVCVCGGRSPIEPHRRVHVCIYTIPIFPLSLYIYTNDF
jgi:hypothetical protein